MIDFCIHNSRVETIDQSDVVNGRSSLNTTYLLDIIFCLQIGRTLFVIFFPDQF